MLFKNLTIYQLPPNFFIGRYSLDAALAKLPSRQPSAQEAYTYGFIAPTPSTDHLVLETPNHALIICAEKIEKIIPAAAVKDLLSKKVSEIETAENRKLAKKEVQRLKDEIIFSILPTALTKSSKTYAYLDFQNSRIVVDSSSAKKAEYLLSRLREALGSLRAVPLNSETHPETVLTAWCTDAETMPVYFTLEREFELRGFENGIIRVKDQDPATEETVAHVGTGMQITKLGLTFDDRLTFVLTDALQVKKLKFLGTIQESIADLDEEDQTQYFTSTAAIQIKEINRLLKALDAELTFREVAPLEPNVQEDEEDLA